MKQDEWGLLTFGACHKTSNNASSMNFIAVHISNHLLLWLSELPNFQGSQSSIITVTTGSLYENNNFFFMKWDSQPCFG